MPSITITITITITVIVDRLYKSADAFVLPSRGEGWGRPHVEAMSMALPGTEIVMVLLLVMGMAMEMGSLLMFALCVE